jgi:amidohydrolase
LSEAADGKFFILDKPTTGAEDFSFFSQQIPGMYFWLGVNEPGVDVAPGNHTPFFKIDDRALDEGVKAMVYLALDYASNN